MMSLTLLSQSFQLSLLSLWLDPCQNPVGAWDPILAMLRMEKYVKLCLNEHLSYKESIYSGVVNKIILVV